MAWVMETEGPEPSSDTQLLTPNQAAQRAMCPPSSQGSPAGYEFLQLFT
jgi:hypothetical protein